MRTLPAMLVVIALLGGCATSGPVNRLSAEAREEIGRMNSAYQTFGDNHAKLAKARIDVDAQHRVLIERRLGDDAHQDLVDVLAEHPSRLLRADLESVRDKLKRAHLDPPKEEEIRQANGERMTKVAAPTEALGAVGTTLKKLERRKTALETFFAYLGFAQETIDLFEAKLKQSRENRDKILEVAPKNPALAAN